MVAWMHFEQSAILTVHNHVITRNPRISVTHDKHDKHRTWFLHINNVQEEDRGRYMCQINTVTAKTQYGFVKVVVPPNIDDALTSSDIIVREGDNVTLRCKAKGSPEPAIKWKRDDGNKIVINKSLEVHDLEADSLELERISRLHMGAYLCIASNGVPPSVSKRIKVSVDFSPMVWIPHQLVGIPMGFNITLECFIEANPTSLNYWTRENDQMIIESYKYDVLAAMKWIACILFIPICAAFTAQKTESDPNTRLLDNILSYVVGDASACGNYFEYACGKYATRHIDDSFTEIIQMLDHKVNKNLVLLMEELNQRSQSAVLNESSVEAKALQFYITCRDASLNTRSAEHYLRLAPPDKGLTWPQLTPGETAWPKEQFKWIKTLGYLHRYGLTNVIVSVMVTQNFENSSEFLLNLSMPSFEEESQHLNSFMETLATLHVMKVPSKSVVPLARKIRRLEHAIRILAEADDDDDESQFMSVQRLEYRTGLNWQMFIELLVDHRISPNFRVQVRNLHYFTALKVLMETSDAQMVASYIMTRFVLYLLNDSMGDRSPIECIKDMRRGMDQASNLIYKERFLEPATLQQFTKEVIELFDQLRRQFQLHIDKNSLGLTSRQNRMVGTKVQDIVLNIGNIPRGRDHRSFVSQYYKDLEFPSADLDYSREHLKLLEFRTQKQMAKLYQPAPSKDEFFFISDPDTAMSSTPYYMIRQNIIIVPHGLFQEPFFVSDSHDVFKYSLLGFTIAHELIHSVDTTGLLFDSLGNADKTGTEISTSPRFEAGLVCMNRNSTQYLDERVADISGLDLAYSAYLRIAKDRNYTDFANTSLEQIFFLNLAQFFCGDSHPTNFVDHDEDQIRLQQMLHGFAPFHKAFGCQTRSFYPEKCQLW
ncbi:membrane metallo-endopeptidase-like 1 isoform X2 [Drosophila rhopaloa]|uniref:Membrane metallo-endopeptidase-like 1 n=1 Tax=Drosophila rhopaloa TaxID=1041015 RepID=A0A6P4DYK2_DRORH|nr:membrane metallo-endopeptidase-like 1 isoform X2 [Drosophila rhopaloa]